MANIINPRMAVLIKGASDWWSDDEDDELEMGLEITKDLDGEPNNARVHIYNLNTDTRTRIIDPSVRNTPIEIHFAPFGSNDLSKCFVGEVQTAKSRPERPGFVTELHCTSQDWQSRSKYLKEAKTYEKGTPISQIIDDLTAVIGLPVQKRDIPTGGILLAQSFSGPAFMLLQKFVFSYGFFVYITDGVLYISNVYSPPNPTVINITLDMMVSEPQPTERKDAVDVIYHTVTDTNGVNPFAKKTKRAKRKWKIKALTRNDYAEFETIDDVILGVDCETLGTPAVNPDNIVTFEGDENQYRVQVVTHSGNTRDGFVTRIEADVFEGETGFGGAFGTDVKTHRELAQLYIDEGGDVAIP